MSAPAFAVDGACQHCSAAWGHYRPALGLRLCAKCDEWFGQESWRPCVRCGALESDAYRCYCAATDPDPDAPPVPRILRWRRALARRLRRVARWLEVGVTWGGAA